MTSIAECDPGVEVPDKLFKDVKYFVVGTVPSNVRNAILPILFKYLFIFFFSQICKTHFNGY